ncbi:hypothetical protein [Schlesneria paludicola]|uniref:hypothetical protein n=1 Tax=Schlesneria paludicola TaxID=360056 RepID=UPI00029ACEBE|nr:hypothetical protein [Schlesneria paludicola]
MMTLSQLPTEPVNFDVEFAALLERESSDGRRKDASDLPSLEQIAEECRAIQASWCDEERRLRSRGELYQAVNAGHHHAKKQAAMKGGAR